MIRREKDRRDRSSISWALEGQGTKGGREGKREGVWVSKRKAMLYITVHSAPSILTESERMGSSQTVTYAHTRVSNCQLCVALCSALQRSTLWPHLK